MTGLSVQLPVAPVTTLTAAEFVARYASVPAELVKGVVQELPVATRVHGQICFRMAFSLGIYLQTQDLGRVATNDTWVRTGSNPDTVRGGDVCYFSYERIPKDKNPDELLAIPPELVVEVKSPSDRWMDLFTKVVEYLKVGVKAVVILDPVTGSASVYRSDELQQIYHNGDQLTLPDILPGFSVIVHDLFV